MWDNLYEALCRVIYIFVILRLSRYIARPKLSPLRSIEGADDIVSRGNHVTISKRRPP